MMRTSLDELTHIDFSKPITVHYETDAGKTESYFGTVDVVGHDPAGNLFVILANEIMLHDHNIIAMYDRLHS